MNLAGGVIGGLIAGIIGAAGWAALAYFAGVESGIIAWIIGGMVGVGTAMGSRGGSVASALLAVIITVLAICGGKYAAIHLSMDKAFNELRAEAGPMSDELLISILADEIVETKAAAGEELDWPAGADREFPEAETDYPAEVWESSVEKWIALGADGQTKFREEREQESKQMFDAMKGGIAREGFIQSFSPIDIIFFLLAMVTAWQIAIKDPE